MMMSVGYHQSNLELNFGQRLDGKSQKKLLQEDY